VARGTIARDRLAVDLEPTEIGVSAVAMATAGHQIGEPDLVDLAEIDLIEPSATRDDFVDIKLDPAGFRESEFALVVIENGSVAVFAQQPGAVGQLHDRVELVETGHLGVPADLAETAHIDVVVLIPQG
jgi:hypothetical protein